jgi:hypothetical protein
MAVTWITPEGTLGTLVERFTVNIPISARVDTLIINNEDTGIPEGTISFELIAGKLPRGLRISPQSVQTNNIAVTFIIGSPTEVKKYTTSRFVIRATITDPEGNVVDIEDRTFTISVDGADVPQWLTKPGFLNVGPGKAYFVLDNSKVDFQLEATDTDLVAGDSLEYYLVPAGGELPPGLSLSRDGRITGFTDPIFALEYLGNTSGSYDTAPFDYVPLDITAQRSNSNGFDTFLYDNVYFDYFESSRVPRRLSRIYTFAVAVTDGLHSVTEIFKIYVVTEEFLQADNTLVQVDTNIFQADATRDRYPLWITESNLGRVRANNYVTIFLDVYDPPTLAGTITYFLMDTNPGTYQLNETGEVISNGRWEISRKYPQNKLGQTITDPDDWTVIIPETVSEIPTGLELDSMTGELAGKIPYQARISKSYNFTLMAVNYPANLSEYKYTFVGDWRGTVTYYSNETINNRQVTNAVRYAGFIWVCTRTNKGQMPEDNSIFWTRGVSTAEKTFRIEVIGEIESGISWISDSDRGSIKPNQPSTLNVKAESLLYGGKVVYEFVEGKLPPGLTLLPTGIIQGKVNQFGDSSAEGLTRFYDHDSSVDESTLSRSFNVTFDNNDTSFDRKFTFTVKARDSLNVSESVKEFFIFVNTSNDKTFANLYVKALQSKNKRLNWYDFITDASIFTPADIYRYGDPNFGIQTEIKMLVYAGIESVEAENFIQAMARNHNNKRLLFGNLKSAKAKDPITQEVIYEVVYVDIVDDYEKNGKSISSTIELPDNINSKVLVSYDKITVDSGSQGLLNDWEFKVSDSDHQRIFPNSIKNMRKRIKNVGNNDREFLPLWMRSIQDTAMYETGYVKAVVLCYVNPGKSAKTISKIKASGFDFKTIDFTIDRYLIDIINGEIEDKYLAFPQRGEKRP